MESDLPNHFPGQLKSESIRLSGCMLSVPSWTSYFVLALFHKRKAPNPPSFFPASPGRGAVPLHASARRPLIYSSIKPAHNKFHSLPTGIRWFSRLLLRKSFVPVLSY